MYDGWYDQQLRADKNGPAKISLNIKVGGKQSTNKEKTELV